MISPFKNTKNKHDAGRGEDCMKKFFQYLKKHPRRLTNLKKKKMKLLTNEQKNSHEKAEICYNCVEMCEDRYANNKIYCKVRYYCNYTGEYRDAVHSICNLNIVHLKKLL